MDKVKAQLALMPPEWLQEFKDHALAADGEEILKLLEFIPEENRDLVEVITQFAENFDFDRILDLDFILAPITNPNRPYSFLLNDRQLLIKILITESISV